MARCLETLATFLYYGAILYAQFGLFDDYCNQVTTDTRACELAMAPYNAWLVIEVVSFYLYIAEVFIYVSSH